MHIMYSDRLEFFGSSSDSFESSSSLKLTITIELCIDGFLHSCDAIEALCYTVYA